MNFKELLVKTNWSDISETMNKCYPNYFDEQYYKRIYFKLLSYDPIENKDNISIFAEHVEHGYDIFAKENGKGRYAIDLTPWKEWLGFNVEVEEMSFGEFAAHCLWEMTFWGGEEEIEGRTNELKEISENIDNHMYETHEETCPLCNGTSDVFGQKCFCDDGKIKVLKYIKD